MKTLIVYYSKTGTTKILAEKLSHELKADIEELIDKKKRTGIFGWLSGGRDGMKKIATELAPMKKDPSKYDMVLIGGPLWGFKSVAPATRTFLLQNRDKIKKAAFFMTKGNSACETAFDDLKEVFGKTAAGTLEIRQKEINSDAAVKRIKAFAALISKKH
jgi:flavodoxin